MPETLVNPHSALLAATSGQTVVVVASTGGHLSQAARWAERLGWNDDSLFITFRNQQSLSLLRDRPHLFVPYVAPRAVGAGLRVMLQLQRIDLRGYFAMVSTGAGVAAAAWPRAVRSHLPFLYLESVSRFAGPSLTGRVLEHLPRVHRFAQYEGYPSAHWTRVEPLLADYLPTAGIVSPLEPRKIFVTLGTIAPYRFDRLIDLVLSQLRTDDEVVWQVGVTGRNDLPGSVHRDIPGGEFSRLIEWADVVVTHAGIGTLLAVLDAGKMPVTAARLGRFREHVDDHQTQALQRLVSLGLAVDLAARPEEALRLAATSAVARR